MSTYKYSKDKYILESQRAADSVGMPEGGQWNGARDAFRHAYTSAIITKEYGPWKAEEMGNAVELLDFFNTESEHWMDERNNATGREIGEWARKNGKTEGEIAGEVKRRIDSGELVVSPYDPRRTYEQH